MSTVVKNFADGEITVEDGTSPTALSVVAQFDTGETNLATVREKLRETAMYETRGSLNSARKTTRVYPTITFSLQFTEFTESSVGNVLDMIYGRAGTPFSARVTTAAVPGDVTQFSVKIKINGLSLGDSSDHELEMTGVEFTDTPFSEGDPNTFSFSCIVLGAITGDLVIAEG